MPSRRSKKIRKDWNLMEHIRSWSMLTMLRYWVKINTINNIKAL